MPAWRQLTRRTHQQPDYVSANILPVLSVASIACIRSGHKPRYAADK